MKILEKFPAYKAEGPNNYPEIFMLLGGTEVIIPRVRVNIFT
jgi:hypothetical protein